MVYLVWQLKIMSTLYTRGEYQGVASRCDVPVRVKRGVRMLCEKCHKNLATVRYAEVVDGRVKHVNLCPDCLAEHQQNSSVGFELAKPAPVTRKTNHSARVDAVSDDARKQRCRNCGHTLGKLLDSGVVGCSTCYETFARQIESMLEGMHRGVRHRGKVPYVDDAIERIRADLQTKRALLRSALSTENYEEAACLRDEIRTLEKQMTTPAGNS